MMCKGKRTGIVLVVFLLFISPEVLSANQDVHFLQANKEYAAGHYDKATRMYTDIIVHSGLSAELLHNLGNCYAAQGNYGQAILHYQRGLRIAPNDHALLSDLKLIKKQAGLFPPKRENVQYILHFFDFNQWLLVSLLGFLGLSLLIAYHSVFGPMGRLGKGLLFLLACLFLFCLIAAGTLKKEWNSAVVVEPGSTLLLSPFAGATSLGTIKPGTLLVCGKKHNGYCSIQDENHRQGWLKTEAFRPIPATSLTYSQGGAEQ